MANMMSKFLKKPHDESPSAAKPLKAPKSRPESHQVEPSFSDTPSRADSIEQAAGSPTKKPSNAADNPSDAVSTTAHEGYIDRAAKDLTSSGNRHAVTTAATAAIASDTPTSRLGEGLRIEGELHASENLVILGEVTGVIHHQGELLTIAATGKIEAGIHTKNLLIEGNVTGDIHCSGSLTIASGAVVSGNIKTTGLSIADGAHFNGNIDMG